MYIYTDKSFTHTPTASCWHRHCAGVPGMWGSASHSQGSLQKDRKPVPGVKI